MSLVALFGLLLCSVLIVGVAVGLPCVPCIACDSCPICSDAFGRADGTDISTGSPCGWTEVAGSWSLSSGKLVTSSTSAYARCDTAHPDGISSAIVHVTIEGAADDELDVIVNANNSNKNNCWIVRFTIGGCVSIIECNGAAAETERTLIDGAPAASTPTPVAVFFGGGNIGVQWGSHELVYPASPTASASYVGLGTKAQASAVRFTAFSFSRYNSGSEADAGCGSIGRGCSIADDTFARADNADPGCQWNTLSGTWSIASHTLKPSATGTIQHRTPNHTGKATGSVIAGLSLGTNDKAAIYLGDTSLVVTILRTSSTLCTVVCNTVTQTSVPLDAYFRVCFTGATLTVDRSNDLATWTNVTHDSATNPAGTHASLGVVTNASGTAAFTYFQYSSADVPGMECPTCRPACTNCNDTVPDAFLVTVTGVTNEAGSCCDTFNASFICDFYKQCSTDSCQWRYDFPSRVCPDLHDDFGCSDGVDYIGVTFRDSLVGQEFEVNFGNTENCPDYIDSDCDDRIIGLARWDDHTDFTWLHACGKTLDSTTDADFVSSDLGVAVSSYLQVCGFDSMDVTVTPIYY